MPYIKSDVLSKIIETGKEREAHWRKLWPGLQGTVIEKQVIFLKVVKPTWVLNTLHIYLSIHNEECNIFEGAGDPFDIYGT